MDEVNKILVIIFTLTALVVSVSLLQSKYDTTKWTQQKPISLPEEIYLAEAGDTLVVHRVSDSIYIQYK
jgi:cell division protein FtsL